MKKQVGIAWRNGNEAEYYVIMKHNNPFFVQKTLQQSK